MPELWILTTTQERDLAIKPLDAHDNPAQIDGIPTWESSAPDILEVIPAPDGLTAKVKAQGKIGAARITATADADLTTGVSHISNFRDFNIVAGGAVKLEIIGGEIREQG